MAVNDNLATLHVGQRYSLDEDFVWFERACPHCGASRMVMIAVILEGGEINGDDLTRWLRCPACKRAALWDGAGMHPPTSTLREPAGLPPEDAALWREARACLSVGANAAAVMMCRKLLLHIAVSHDLPAKDGKGRSPSFAAAAKHLEAEGVVSAPMRPWVERIKDVGNVANHELAPVTPGQALDVAKFTQQLLVLAYEIAADMANSASPEES